MINPDHLASVIVYPAMGYLKTESPNALALIMGTGAQETAMGQFLIQSYFKPGDDLSSFKGGRGWLQGQKDDHDDINTNVIQKNAFFKQQFASLYTEINADYLYHDLFYAVMIARLHYWRHSEPIPDRKDLPALAAYYKKYYNSGSGAATEQEFIDNYNKYAHDAVEKYIALLGKK